VYTLITFYVHIWITFYMHIWITSYVHTLITFYVHTLITFCASTLITFYVHTLITFYVHILITFYVHILITFLLILVPQVFTNISTLHCLTCCCAWYRHELYCLMTIHTNVLYISCISRLPDEGSEMVETCSRLTVRHINVTRVCAGLTGLYRV
jgi:hypothetical protein